MLSEEGLIEVAGLASRWVRLANGAKAHYVTSGDSGPAVVLLHGGLPGSSGTAGWRFMAPFLAAHGFRVYCPDQPGFGLADNRPEYWPSGVHSHVDFLHDFTTALCLDRFHLAGNSMGCTNTVNYVIAHPEQIISFILIAGDVGDLLLPGQRPPSKTHLDEYDGTRDGMRKMMSAIIHHEETISDDLIEMRWLSAERQKGARAQWWNSMLQFRQDVPWEDENLAARLSTKGRFDRLDLPALCLYGRQDVLTPWSGATTKKMCCRISSSSIRMSAVTRGRQISRTCSTRSS